MTFQALCPLALALVAHVVSAAPAPKPFSNITEECGVAAVVKAHYRNVPKWWFSGIDLLDLDGDGDLDLHLAGHGHPAAAAFNDGKGRFTYVDPKLAIPRGVRHDQPIPYPGGEIRLAFDFDEDGKVDILASWHDGGGVLYRNESRPGAWNFTRPRSLDHFNRACAMADINRDGIVDYLADEGGRTRRRVLAFFGKAKGAFGEKRLVADALHETCPIPVDIDRDGDLDFLISRRGYNPPGRRILRNDGNLDFADITKKAGLTEDGGSIHGAGDLDQDGDLDLICVEGTKPPLRLVIYLNDGKGRFTPKRNAIAGAEKLRPYSANWGGAVTTDIDNDGVADILVNGKYFLYVLRGTGGGSFTIMNEAWGIHAGAWSAVDEGLCFGDIDADGDLDLITCDSTPTGKRKTISVFRNDLPRQNWLRVRLTGRKGNRSAAGAKIRIFEAGGLGDPKRLIWYEQVAIWGRQSFHSYYTASATERHFGLGRREAVDLSVQFYPSGKRVDLRAARAGATAELREE